MLRHVKSAIFFDSEYVVCQNEAFTEQQQPSYLCLYICIWKAKIVVRVGQMFKSSRKRCSISSNTPKNQFKVHKWHTSAHLGLKGSHNNLASISISKSTLTTLLPISRFVLAEKFRRIASKFAIFYMCI